MIQLNYNDNCNEKIVIALGFFDSMHVGHKTLVDSARKLANELNAKTAVFTFSNNHFAVLNSATKLIFTLPERLEIYKQCGADIVVTAEFNKHFMSMSGHDFLTALTQNKGIVGVICGDDYTCGGDRKGSSYVKQFCQDSGIICNVVETIVNNADTKISSTMVRTLLADNDIVTANKLLTVAYHISGKVVHGRGVGRKLGFATANLLVESDKLLPIGVFAGFTTIGGTAYRCLINIGSAPTFGVEKCNVEVHLIDFDGAIYDDELTVYLTKFIRSIVKFDSAESLIKQLNSDLLEANK